MRTMTDLSSHPSKQDLCSLLSYLNTECLKEFIHRCTDEICGRKGPSEEKFCSSCAWTCSQFQAASSGVKAFLVKCVTQSFDRNKIEEVLPLNESQVTAVMNCITVRGDELQTCLLGRYQYDSSQALQDHDWKLKWVMGSSSLSSHRDTLLELDLNTVKRTNCDLANTESQRGRIRVELTRENVNSLIHILEKAEESV